MIPKWRPNIVYDIEKHADMDYQKTIWNNTNVQTWHPIFKSKGNVLPS